MSLRWQVDHQHWRGLIDKDGDGYRARLYNRLTEEGRQGRPCATSEVLPTVRAARAFIYSRVGAPII